MRSAVVVPLGLTIGALGLCGFTTPAAATRAPSPIKVRVTVVRHRTTAGRPIKGSVVFTNTTTRPITVDTCAANGWLAVGLQSRTYAPSFVHTLVACQPTVRLHPGPNRFSVTVRTTYGSCVQPQPAGTSSPTPKIPSCTIAGPPPLPAGKYVTKVEIAGLSGLTRNPNGVRISLRPPAHPAKLAACADRPGTQLSSVAVPNVLGENSLAAASTLAKACLNALYASPVGSLVTAEAPVPGSVVPEHSTVTLTTR